MNVMETLGERLIVLRQYFFCAPSASLRSRPWLGTNWQKAPIYPGDTNYHLLLKWAHGLCVAGLLRSPQWGRATMKCKSLHGTGEPAHGRSSLFPLPCPGGRAFSQKWNPDPPSQRTGPMLKQTADAKTLAHKTNYLRIVHQQSFKIEQSICIGNKSAAST